MIAIVIILRGLSYVSIVSPQGYRRRQNRQIYPSLLTLVGQVTYKTLAALLYITDV